jgi:hypothetical protein
MKTFLRFVALTALLVLATVSGIAQEAALAPPDYKKLAVDLITVVTPVLTVLVLWGFKLVWSKLPASIVVFAAPALGIALNFLLSYVTGQNHSDPIVAALLGSAGVYLREILSTLQSKGLAGPVTATKGML